MRGVPIQIQRGLTQHLCTSVQKAGWGSYTNGALLAKADGIYDLFITAGQNLKYQQNLAGRSIAILELSTNRRKIVESNFTKIEEVVSQTVPGGFVSLELE